MIRSIALVALAVLAAAGAVSAQPPFPVIGKQAPDFQLVDQQARPTRLSQFRGKLLLMAFIYTNCPDVCPLTTASMARVQEGLRQRGWWVRDVMFLSITTDPVRDTPPVLAAYAKKYKADGAGWRFLTGHPAAVAQVLRLYGITVTPKGRFQEHALPVFVIDRGGQVLGAYGYNLKPEDVLSDLAKLR